MFYSRTRIGFTAALTAAALTLAACSGEAGADEPGTNGVVDAGASQTEVVDALEVLTPPGQIDGFAKFDNGTDKTFGHFVCVNVEQVTLESVEPVAMEGDIEFLGTLVYETSEAFVGAVEGFPPNGVDPSATKVGEGAVVTLGCDVADPVVQTQLLLGANRTGPGGGKIDGIRVSHSEGTLEILDYRIILCGDDYEYCESLRPEE